MVAERIEQLKSEYTDKYVKVDAARPELARFRDIVGQIKTVNMNGRALVEFLDYHLNTGWYDVDLSCLEVVDKPPPKVEKKPEAKKSAEKPAAKKTGDDIAGPKAESPAKAPAKPTAGKQSVADILAAARAGKSAPAKSEASPASAGGSAAEKPAPAAPASAPPKVDRAKMSVADMLAAARGGKGAPAAGAAPAAPAKPSPPPPEPEAAAPPAEKAAAVAPAKPAGEAVKVDRTSMSLDDKIAYCRKVDAK